MTQKVKQTGGHASTYLMGGRGNSLRDVGKTHPHIIETQTTLLHSETWKDFF